MLSVIRQFLQLLSDEPQVRADLIIMVLGVILALIFGFLGRSLPRTFGQAIRIRRERHAKENDERFERALALYGTQSKVGQLIRAYYPPAPPFPDYTFYSFCLDSRVIDTTILVDTNDVGTPIALDLIVAGLVPPKEPVANPSFVSLARRATPAVRGRLERMGVRTDNLPLYRLRSFDLSKPAIEFSVTDFLDYRFTSGLLGDELNQALCAWKGDIRK